MPKIKEYEKDGVLKQLKSTIENKADSDREKIVGFLSDMVKINTVNPPGNNYEKFADFIKKKFSGFKNADVKIINTPKAILEKWNVDPAYPRPNVIIDFDYKQKKTIHFNGHIDVVPASDDWKDAFNPKESAGKLYGRGTYDMKSNFAVIYFIMKYIEELDLTPECNIQLSFTVDEETGGKTGFGYLIDSGYIKGDYFLGEGSSDEIVGIGSKGVLWQKIEFTGKSAHGAYPHEGDNAFEKMILAGSALLKLKKEINSRETLIDVQAKENKCATINIGATSGSGDKTNVVPDKAFLTFDRRINPEEDMESVKKEIYDAVKKVTDDFTITTLNESLPYVADLNNNATPLFNSILKEVTGKEPRFIMLNGGTDLRYVFEKNKDAVVFGYNPKGGNMHSNDEYVEIDSLLKAIVVFGVFLVLAD